jgi:hypothetical protein
MCDFCANLKFKKAATTGQRFITGTIWQKNICQQISQKLDEGSWVGPLQS